MNKINKKGISTIVATVLIVLITVAAVTILWAAISPMLNITDKTSCVGAVTDYEIDTNGEYSTTISSSAIDIRVKNNGDSTADKVKLTLNINGDTYALTTLNTNSIVNLGVMDRPIENGAVKVSVTGITPVLTTNSNITASVTPILSIDGQDVICSGAAEVDIMNNLA